MENTKYTKGEWVINKQASNTVQVKGTNRSIASTGGYSVNGTDAELIYNENIANAKLISASPDLLEVLIEVRSKIQYEQGLNKLSKSGKDWSVELGLINTAINKATK